jgi:hypothetical protein
MSSASVVETTKRLTLGGLARLIDVSTEHHRDLLVDSERLKKKIQEIQATKREVDMKMESIKAEILKAMMKFGLRTVAGERYEARVGEGRPSFRFDGDFGQLREPFVEYKPKLNDAECLAAYKRGELPEEIQAWESLFVKFDLRRRG